MSSNIITERRGKTILSLPKAVREAVLHGGMTPSPSTLRRLVKDDGKQPLQGFSLSRVVEARGRCQAHCKKSVKVGHNY